MRHVLLVVVPIVAALLIGGTTVEVKPVDSRTPESDLYVVKTFRTEGAPI